MVPEVSNNKSINLVSDSNSDSSDEDFENNEDNFFNKNVNGQLKISSQTTVNAKVVKTMKKLQASYNKLQMKKMQSKIEIFSSICMW